MVAESSQDKLDSLIDKLIDDILRESGVADTPERGKGTTAALLEHAIGSTRRPSRLSRLERVLFIEAIAAELADALAPALAEQLASRFLKAFEQDGKQSSRAETNKNGQSR